MGISRTYEWADVLTLAGLNARSDKIPDNFFDGMGVLELMQKAGNVRVEEAGDRIIEHIMVDENSQAQDYSGYDEVTPAASEGLTTAEYQWAQVMIPVTISGRELRSQSPKQVKQVWKAKMEQAILSLKDKVNKEIMLSDQSTSPYTEKSIAGFPLMIAESPTASYAGVNPSKYAKWANYYAGSTGVYSTYLLAAMQAAWIGCSRGRRSGIPKVIITDPIGYKLTEALIASKMYYVLSSMAQDIDLGTGDLKFKQIPVIYDMNLGTDSNSQYKQLWVNTNYTKLHIHPDANFTPTPWVRPHKQDAICCQILVQVQLTTNNRRHNGVVFGITAS